jgi:hypothetical protein
MHQGRTQNLSKGKFPIVLAGVGRSDGVQVLGQRLAYSQLWLGATSPKIKTSQRSFFLKVACRVTDAQDLGGHSHAVWSVCYLRVGLVWPARFRCSVFRLTGAIPLDLKRIDKTIRIGLLGALPALKLRVLCAIQRSDCQQRMATDCYRRLDASIPPDRKIQIYVAYDARSSRNWRICGRNQIDHDNSSLRAIRIGKVFGLGF